MNVIKRLIKYIVMHIIVLGGCNDENGYLYEDTKNRCDKAIEILDKFTDNELLKNTHIHFSGGFNIKFNKMFNPLSHSKLCCNYFKSKYNFNNIILHESNNCTVDESINFGKYLQNCDDEVIIITNNWHMNRTKYLFEKTFNFYKITNFKFIEVYSKNTYPEEVTKLNELKNNPYGTFLNWMNGTEMFNI